MDDAERKKTTSEQFDAHATEYTESPVHRDGSDLRTLTDWCAGAERALDVATGAGATAGALADSAIDTVVAVDGAPSMIGTATAQFPDVHGTIGDAETLPFRTDAFDAVTCRIAAHHFPKPSAFVDEIARILRPGGVFALEDNVAPDDDELDAFLNDVERLRDPTHHRSHRIGDWRRWLDHAGLDHEETLTTKKTLQYEDWLERLSTSRENRARLRERFQNAPAGADERFKIERREGNVESWANLKALIRARNPRP